MKDLARKLRQYQPPSEQLLWRYLRNHHLQGFGFRRQHVIGSYIVDFCCFDHRLVIEIDGEVHSEGDRPALDAKRQGMIERMGYRVIRFTSEEVMTNLEGVLQAVLMALNEDTPHPSPPPEREREPF